MPCFKLVRVAVAAAAMGLAGAFTALPANAQPKAVVTPLRGTDVHFEYDGLDVGRPERAWLGRAFVHHLAAAEPNLPRPMVVFIHGTNAALIKYRWMGGGPEGDLRRVLSELMDSGQIEPVILAGPSAILPSVVANARNIWPSFDLDLFVRLASEKLHGRATVDRRRIIVVAHSGGGCNPNGGIATALQGTLVPMAALSVDSCMDTDLAALLARARPETRIVVTWQTQGWATRPFEAFVKAFHHEVELAAFAEGVQRELDEATVLEPMPHDAILPLALRKWLPRLLSPGDAEL